MVSEIIYNVISSALDIIFIAIFIYYVLKLLIRSEKHSAILVGILAFGALAILANVMNLYMTSQVINNIFSWGPVILVILFVDEIKVYLEQFGTGKFFKKATTAEEVKYIDGLTSAVFNLASTKTGALITIKKMDSLNKFTQSAVKLDAEFSSFLLESIFQKDSPLHDGAVVIIGEKIAYASVYFPIAIDANVSKKYGTRHRAAYTISKETDSLSIIISEETGNVSVAIDAFIHENVSENFFKELITEKVIQE